MSEQSSSSKGDVDVRRPARRGRNEVSDLAGSAQALRVSLAKNRRAGLTTTERRALKQLISALARLLGESPDT
jgi:hypothetical protein